MVSNEFIYNELKEIQSQMEKMSEEILLELQKSNEDISVIALESISNNLFNKVESLCALINYSEIESNDYYHNYIIPLFKDLGLLQVRIFSTIKAFDEDYQYEPNKYCEFNEVLLNLDEIYVDKIKEEREEANFVLTTQERPNTIFIKPCVRDKIVDILTIIELDTDTLWIEEKIQECINLLK